MSFRMIVPSAVSSGYPFRRRTGHIRYTDPKILCSPVPSAYPLDGNQRITPHWARPVELLPIGVAVTLQ